MFPHNGLLFRFWYEPANATFLYGDDAFNERIPLLLVSDEMLKWRIHSIGFVVLGENFRHPTKRNFAKI